VRRDHAHVPHQGVLELRGHALLDREHAVARERVGTVLGIEAADAARADDAPGRCRVGAGRRPLRRRVELSTAARHRIDGWAAVTEERVPEIALQLGRGTLRAAGIGLLADVGELVGEQLEAGVARRGVAARAKIDVVADREGACLHAGAHRVGFGVGVDPHRGQVATESGLELCPPAGVEGRALAAACGDALFSRDGHVMGARVRTLRGGSLGSLRSAPWPGLAHQPGGEGRLSRWGDRRFEAPVRSLAAAVPALPPGSAAGRRAQGAGDLARDAVGLALLGVLRLADGEPGLQVAGRTRAFAGGAAAGPGLRGPPGHGLAGVVLSAGRSGGRGRGGAVRRLVGRSRLVCRREALRGGGGVVHGALRAFRSWGGGVRPILRYSSSSAATSRSAAIGRAGAPAPASPTGSSAAACSTALRM